jgi:hypothetical protein
VAAWGPRPWVVLLWGPSLGVVQLPQSEYQFGRVRTIERSNFVDLEIGETP